MPIKITLMSDHDHLDSFGMVATTFDDLFTREVFKGLIKSCDAVPRFKLQYSSKVPPYDSPLLQPISY